MRLSAKIIGTIIALAVFATGVVVFFVSRSVTSSLQEAIETQQFIAAQETMDKIDRLLYERYQDIQTIAGAPSVQSFLIANTNEATEGSAQQFRQATLRQLKSFSLQTGPWDNLEIFTVDAKELMSIAEFGKEQANQQETVIVTTALAGKPAYSDVVISETTGLPTILFAAPIRDESTPDKRIIGSVLGELSWPVVEEILTAVSIDARLLNSKGQLIAGHKGELFTDFSSYPATQNALHGNDGSAIQKEFGEDVNVLASYISQKGYLGFKGNSWVMVLFTPTETAFASARAAVRTIAIVMALVMFLLLVGVIFFLFSSVLRPVNALSKTAQAIAKGDTYVKAAVDSNDEIGMLARSFNEMTDRLAAYPRQLEKEVRGKTNELNELNKSLQAWLKENDEIGKILVRRDLELTQSNEQLRDLDEAKSQFVSVAAHQLRTPLAGIKWTLYALLEEKMGRLNKEQEKFAGDAYKATVRLIDLVNDLLDVARLEEGRSGFKIKKQSLMPLVKKAYENFQKAATGKGIKFSLELPKEDIPFLDFDEEKIAIVLENLVDNAIKYTAPGGRVTVSLSKEKNRVSVEVADTGIGIPADQIGRVFAKFFRGENAQLYQTSGTGLGLYLAQNIVAHHGGAMFFKTEENKGSTFTFSLPIPKSGIKKV